MRPCLRIAFLSGAALFVASCAATQTPAATDPAAAANFLFGLWHGFIAPITFVVSLFSETVRVYAVPNTGIGYDFGFMLGLGGFSGGIFGGGRKASEGKKRSKGD
jgi:hypothetical protein